MPDARFQFLDPGVLSDGELELVPPQLCWVDDLLAACSHPRTVREAPAESHTTRPQLLQYLNAFPLGHDAGGGARVPQYSFWMRVHGQPDATASPELRIAGGVALRIGATHAVEMYYGHVGYHVYPAARGNHYAERACRLLLPLARRHGMRHLWITCNPDNLPSRRTCERLGAQFVEIVPVPDDNPLYLRGERHKCRYWLEL